MATLQELETALVNADKAGDGEAARILAQEIQARRWLDSSGLAGASYVSHRSKVLDPESPPPMARVGRGMMDVAQGTKQLYLNATDPEAARQYTKDVDAEIARYEKARGPGFDFLRLGGNVLAGTPMAAVMASAAPEAATASILGRTLLAAGQGAAQGAIQYAPEGQSKGRQVVAGAAGGTLGSIGGEIVGRALARLTQAAQRGATRLTVSPDDVVNALRGELQARGIDWNKLGAEVRTGLVNQARRQLAVNGDLSPDALARKLEMDDMLGAGAGGTMGQVTRNPQLWTQERNLQKGEAAFGREGDATLTDRYQVQIQRLQQRLDDAIRNAQGKAQNEFQAGASALGGVRQKMDASKKVVDDLYQVWRETGQGGTEVAPQPIADTLGRVADEFGVEHIPPTVRARLESFGMMGGKQTKLLTIDEAEKLRRLIQNNIDPGNKTQMRALGILKESVDDAVMATNAPEIPSLQAARKAAAARFAMRDSAPAVTAAADAETQPDRFFRRFVLNGDVRDLQGLKATLTTDVGGAAPTAETAQAWRDLQGQTLRHIFEKATGDRGDQFSGRAFSKALKEIGDERLKVLFDADQIANLQKLARVANDVTTEPAFSAVNHSNTAPTMMQYAGSVLKRVANLPGVSVVGLPLVGAAEMGEKSLRDLAMRQKVSQALTGEVVDPTMASQRYAELVRLLARRSGPLSGVAGASTALEGLSP